MTERTPRARPFAYLKRHGLRVTRHLDIRAKYIDVNFEVPTQLNSAPMLIYKSVSIGAYTYLRSGIVKHVRSIGRYCSLGPNVTLGEGEHPMGWLSTSMVSYMPAMYAWYPPELEDAPKRLRPRTVETDESMEHGQVTIGNDVWIGTNAMIRRGVTVGDGAVIGAGAYVNRDVEPYSVVAGVPARVIRMRFDDATIEALKALRWWEFHANDLIGVPFESPQDAIPMIEDMEAAGTLARWPVTYRTARLTRQGYTRIVGVPRPAKANEEETPIAEPAVVIATAAAALAVQEQEPPAQTEWDDAPAIDAVDSVAPPIMETPEAVEDPQGAVAGYVPGVRFDTAVTAPPTDDAAVVLDPAAEGETNASDSDTIAEAVAAALALDPVEMSGGVPEVATEHLAEPRPADPEPIPAVERGPEAATANHDEIALPETDLIGEAVAAALAADPAMQFGADTVEIAAPSEPGPGDWRRPDAWRIGNEAAATNGSRVPAVDHPAPAGSEIRSSQPAEPMTDAVLAAFALDGLEEELAAHRLEIDGDEAPSDDPAPPANDPAVGVEPEAPAAPDPDRFRVIFPWSR